jgi:hypothetical protein
MNEAEKITLIVASEPETSGESDEAVAQGVREQLARLRIFHRPKEVELDKLQDGLRRVQGQLDQLLTGVNRSTVAGFRLTTVEVSLAISAEGSIGVATAGVEASMSLSFERLDGPS